MRIGILTQYYDPEPGPAAIPGSLARALALAGHEVRVLTGYPNYPLGRLYEGYHQRWRGHSSELGVQVLRVPIFPSHSSSARSRLLNYGSFAITAASATRYLSDVDALWVYSSPPSVSLPTWIASTLSGSPTLLHLMDFWPDSLYASGFLPWVRDNVRLDGLLRAALRSTYRAASRIAYISPGVRRLLINEGVPEHKLTYIPLWTDESLFYPREPDPKRVSQLGLLGKTVLMYAGAVGNAQGLDSLLEVARRVEDLPDFAIVVVGTGVAEARLRQKAADNRLRNVQFLGHRPKTEMAALLPIGHVHLVSLSSTHLADASTPSKMQTTMAIARPMIVSAGGDAAQIATLSGAGWVAHAGDVDELECAVRNAAALGPELLAQRGVAARAYYDREFSVASGSAKVLAALQTATM